MRVLITGASGFIGHHLVDHLLNETNWEIVALDRIDATSTPSRLRFVKNWSDHATRVKFVWHDLRAPLNLSVCRQVGTVDAVLHLAGSTHVDRSIEDPLLFVHDNVVGTANLLNWWREAALSHNFFLHFSTDEVFGPAALKENFGEWSRYNSSNPYAASKAGAEELAVAFSNTYKLKTCVIHTMNVFGERQHPEKFIPKVIWRILRGDNIQIHSDPVTGISGSRFYIHASNVARAVHWLVERRAEAKLLDKWNLVGEREISNLELVQMIERFIGKPANYELVGFPSNRPGHDARYSLDGTKLREAGFSYPENLDQSLERTVRWFVENPDWLGEL